jgi:hypothetical protein
MSNQHNHQHKMEWLMAPDSGHCHTSSIPPPWSLSQAQAHWQSTGFRGLSPMLHRIEWLMFEKSRHRHTSAMPPNWHKRSQTFARLAIMLKSGT